MQWNVLVIHGPNLNLLGWREPEVYGRLKLPEIDERLAQFARERGVEVRSFQSNHEGAIVDAIHEAIAWANGLLINPGAYAPTSYAIREAIAAAHLPTVEVHLTHLQAPEPLRLPSVITPACLGVVAGFGWRSYLLGLQALADALAGQL